MSLRQPWFLVMVPKVAARRNDFWDGSDAKLPRGDVMARLVKRENRSLLLAFGFAWLVAALLIWIWGYGSGVFSPAFAVLATVLAAGVAAASYVRLICVQMVRSTTKRCSEM
ncbi:MAG: hypothetical protein K2Y71_09250 [Xanthobacteraceae bacterium]|nr:hypothetical protein [Xanthobacteraceae bacterium]